MLRMTRRHRSPLGSSPRRVFRFLSSQSCQAYNFHYQYLCLLLPGLMTSGFSVKHDSWMQSWYKMLNRRSNPVVEQPSPFKAVGICMLQISWRQPLLLWLCTLAHKTYIKHIRKNGPRIKKAAFTTALCSSAADPWDPKHPAECNKSNAFENGLNISPTNKFMILFPPSRTLPYCQLSEP